MISCDNKDSYNTERQVYIMLHEIYTVNKHCQGENFYKQDRCNFKYVKIVVRKKKPINAEKRTQAEYHPVDFIH